MSDAHNVFEAIRETAAMEQIHNYGDDRQLARCVYCAGNTESRDHVPSRILLDEPYPLNLPVVPACETCNEAFSLDEEYVACLVECAVAGSTSPEAVLREKIKRVLRRKPALTGRLTQARKTAGDIIPFHAESARVRNVVLKLARGHAAFELNEPQHDDPATMFFQALPFMGEAARRQFETPIRTGVWPEVGSRAMQRLVVSDAGLVDWIVVQPGRYRYLVAVGQDVLVRFVLSEYLACEVGWKGQINGGQM